MMGASRDDIESMISMPILLPSAFTYYVPYKISIQDEISNMEDFVLALSFSRESSSRFSTSNKANISNTDSQMMLLMTLLSLTSFGCKSKPNNYG